MNDIDIVDDARDYARRMMEGHAASLVNRLCRELLLARDAIAALAAEAADAIETGRQWETIARLGAELAEDASARTVGWWDRRDFFLAAFRDLADRTPTPTDGACQECGGVGWIHYPEHEMSCRGDCENHGCPVPVQRSCPSCAATPQPATTSDEEPF